MKKQRLKYFFEIVDRVAVTGDGSFIHQKYT